jgi:hypothetical protein
MTTIYAGRKLKKERLRSIMVNRTVAVSAARKAEGDSDGVA